ncbi:MAG: hypothetical protein ABGZ35_04615, partial [Planctomycetaceae bacterium]
MHSTRVTQSGTMSPQLAPGEPGMSMPGITFVLRAQQFTPASWETLTGCPPRAERMLATLPASASFPMLPASGLVACLVMFSAHAKAGELPEQSTGFAYSNRLRSEVV